MAKLLWIKLATDTFDDWKMRYIDELPNRDLILAIWFKLLTFAGRDFCDGYFMYEGKPITIEYFCAALNRNVEQVQTAFDVFVKLNMIEYVDNAVFLKHWEKWQNTESVNKERENTRKRVAAHRAKKQANTNVTSDVTECNGDVTNNVTECNVTSNADVTSDVTECNAVDKNRVEENRKEECVCNASENVTTSKTVEQDSGNAESSENTLSQYFIQKYQHLKDKNGRPITSAVSQIENWKEWKKWWQETNITQSEIDAAFENLKNAVDSGEQDRKYIPKKPDRFVLGGWLYDWSSKQQKGKREFLTDEIDKDKLAEYEEIFSTPVL